MASEQLKPATVPGLAMEDPQPQQGEKDIMYRPEDGSGPADKANEEAKEDSFVKHITSRSPAKRVSRIEDSVEALDKLEEEIEKVGQAMTPPPVANGLPPPPKTEQPEPTVSKAHTMLVKYNATAQKGVPSKAASEASKPVKRSAPAGGKGMKPKENRASLLRQGIKPTSPARAEKPAPSSKALAPRATTKAPSSAPHTRRASPAAGKAPSQPSNPINKGPAPGTRRVSSVTRAPFQPAKSTKAPTQSTFELPGEAISRKKREQREERLRKEEEEKLSKKSFKARPSKQFPKESFAIDKPWNHLEKEELLIWKWH